MKKTFKNNKLKYSSISTIGTTLFLLAIILINLIVGKFDVSKDLTKNKMFSLSNQTNKVLSNLKKDVNIYVLYETGKENYAVTTLLKQYQSNSKHVKLIYKDPVKNPQILEKYTKDNSKPEVGSIIIESGSNFKVIDQSSLVNFSFDATGSPSIDSLAIEQSVTSGILNILSPKKSNIYVLEGHEETPLDEQITKQLGFENFAINNINLSTKDAQLKEDSTLIITSPKRDLSTSETETIKTFLSKGGKALFLMDLVENPLPNFNSIFKEYGLEVQRAIAIETNSMFVSQNPLYLLPKQESNEILNPLNSNNLRTLIPGGQPIKLLENKKSSLTVTPLLVTSDKSWGKTNLNSDSFEKEPSDIAGPLNVAASVSNKVASGKETRLVVVGNGSFINSKIASLSNNANIDFFMNSINWCADRKDNLSIRPKNLENYPIQLTGFQKLTFTGFVIIIIPAIILICGIIVWIKRKKK